MKPVNLKSPVIKSKGSTLIGAHWGRFRTGNFSSMNTVWFYFRHLLRSPDWVRDTVIIDLKGFYR